MFVMFIFPATIAYLETQFPIRCLLSMQDLFVLYFPAGICYLCKTFLFCIFRLVSLQDLFVLYFQVGICYLCKGMKKLCLGLVAIAVVWLAFILVTPLGFPYNGNTDHPSPMRLLALVSRHYMIVQIIVIRSLKKIKLLYYYASDKVCLGVYRNHPVRLFIFLLMATPPILTLILIKIYTVVVYDLRMCMKEDNPGLKKNIKGDNSRRYSL